MSEYEPFEAPQGDPWSTEPVGDYAHQRREQGPESQQDDSEVLARVPHLGDESGSDHYRQYGNGGSSQRRHRGPSRRPGIPAPVWVVVGMGLVALIVGPFFMGNDSGNEASVEMPAPNADLAPTWPAGDPSSQWQQPGAWPQEPAPTATATAAPAAPGAWNTAGDWVGAPSNGPYGHNVAENTAQTPLVQDANTQMPPMGSAPSVGWDTSVAPPSPVEPNHQALGAPSQPGYPAAGAPTANWSDRAAAPLTSPQPYPTQPTPNANPWGQAPPTPSLATPQPENVMPGYGTYPTAQPNPYVGNPAPSVPDYRGGYAGAPANTRAADTQYPNHTPNYPVAGQPAAQPYPVPGYPQTARVPNPAAPRFSVPPAGPSTYPTPAAPYSYPPTTTIPYAPQTAPAVPNGQPYQGTGLSNEASQHSVARLNGTIQEPAARTAYDDRAQPSYY